MLRASNAMSDGVNGASIGRVETIIGAMINDTKFMTLTIGLSAGPAVSLSGSPTVSPTTAAL